MYWERVLNEVWNKHDPSYRFVFTHCYQRLTKPSSEKTLDNDLISRRHKMKNYFFGGKIHWNFFYQKKKRNAWCIY